jgi:hypothetical protein
MKKKVIIGAAVILAAVAAVWSFCKIRAAKKKHKTLPGDIPVR